MSSTFIRQCSTSLELHKNYWNHQTKIPAEEDLDLAECHLKAAPLDTLRTEIHTYRVAYFTAMHDLHWWRHDFEKSIEYAEQGKQLCIKGKITFLLPRLEARLKQLAIIINEQNLFDQLEEECL